MLGFGRRRQAGVEAATQIDADLTGAVISGGQVAIGEHIVQIHADHGAVVNYSPPVVPQPRPTPIRRLPRPFDGLVGRDALLGEIHAAIATGEPTELVGASGIGKTTLLRNTAHHLAELRRDGVVYTRAAGLPASDVLQLLFETFYDTGGTTVIATPAQLSQLLGPLEALILVDDVEMVREELDALTSSIPGCTVVTGSSAQRLWGEGRSVPVPGLVDDAVLALLEQELGRELTANERAPLLRSCRDLGSAPLRVLQVAGLVRSGRLPAETGTAVDQLLAGELTDADRLVIAPLAAVAAAVPTETVAAVSGIGQAAQLLEALEGRHLVQSHSPRYTLAADVADRAAADRGYAGLVAASVQHEPTSPELLLALSCEAERRRRLDDVIALAHAADRELGLGGRWGAWEKLLERARRAAVTTGAAADEAWACHQLGSRALAAGDPVTAVNQLSRALGLRQRLGDQAGASVTQHNLDLLGGGGGPGGRGDGPRPRLPLVAGATLVAVAAAVAIAVGASGGGSTGHSSTGRSITSITSAQSTPTSSTSTARRTRTVTTRTSGHTTKSSHSSAQPPPPLALTFDPDPVVVKLTVANEATGQTEVTVTNATPAPLSLTITSSQPAYTVEHSSCDQLAAHDMCKLFVVVTSPTPSVPSGTLTFTAPGGRTAGLGVSVCTEQQSSSSPTSTNSSTTTNSTTTDTTPTNPAGQANPASNAVGTATAGCPGTTPTPG